MAAGGFTVVTAHINFVSGRSVVALLMRAGMYSIDDECGLAHDLLPMNNNLLSPSEVKFMPLSNNRAARRQKRARGGGG